MKRSQKFEPYSFERTSDNKIKVSKSGKDEENQDYEEGKKKVVIIPIQTTRLKLRGF